MPSFSNLVHDVPVFLPSMCCKFCKMHFVKVPRRAGEVSRYRRGNSISPRNNLVGIFIRDLVAQE